MKTIGLIGGMSWESTQVYYRILNEKMKEKLGGSHSCECILYSVDFAEVERLQHEGNWDALARQLTDIAIKLQAAGAELILIGTNTMHKNFDTIQKQVDAPLLHIADTAADAIVEQRMKRVGLIGTRFTMEQDFYADRLRDHGIEVVIPDVKARMAIHEVIFFELTKGIISDVSRRKLQNIVDNLEKKGAEGVVLGCTELPMLLDQQHSRLPLFDTTRLHAEAAVNAALRKHP
ncbi:MAG TPA: aspartate/glutamate racemase family protein [Bacillales bacterium]|nr:aspartate/glutamate racemase family protein [Bacillales bacterium]